MFRLRILIPALLAIAAIPGISQAQLSLPFAKKTYCVQVQYEMWRNGSTYWSTVFETENQADAQLMYELLQNAYDDGVICDMLNCGFDWIIRDVRLYTKYEYYQIDRNLLNNKYPFNPKSPYKLK
ncbi:MAG: hypothetical protein ACE5KM_01755 [Planctomycetaceae bacterium]